MYAKQIDSIRSVPKDTRRTTQPFSDKLTFIGKLIYKFYGEQGVKNCMKVEKLLSYKK